MLNDLTQNRPDSGNDFVDCCIKNHLSPADAGELLYEELGIDGDELISVLLK